MFFIFLVLLQIFFFNDFFKNIFLERVFYNSCFWKVLNVLNNNNLNIFLFFIMLFIFFINELVITKNLLLKITFLVFFCINCLNFNFVENQFFNFDINLNLINGLIIIHPLCMYMGCVISFNFFFIYFLKFLKNYNYTNCLAHMYINLKLKFYFYSFLALFLGCFWAQQEINWGGFWNWDFVEIISLIFFLFSLIFTHSKSNVNILLLKHFNLSFFLCIFLFFFIVRLDILNSIHSFSFFKLKNNFINIINILIIIYFVLIYFLKFKNKIKYYFNIYFFNVINVFFYFFNFFLIFLILFNIILNYLLNYNLINLNNKAKNLIILVLLINILFNINQIKFLKLNFIWLILNNILLISNYFLLKKKLNYKNYIIHYVILIILFFLIKNNYLLIKKISVINDNLNVVINNWYFFYNNNLLKYNYLNNFYLHNKNYLSNYIVNTINFNSVGLTNTIKINCVNYKFKFFKFNLFLFLIYFYFSLILLIKVICFLTKTYNFY